MKKVCVKNLIPFPFGESLMNIKCFAITGLRGVWGEKTRERERKKALQEIRQPKINRSSRKNITKPLQPHSTSTEFQDLLQTIKKQNRHQRWDTVPKYQYILWF